MELPIGNVYQQSPRDERSTQWGPFNWHRTALAMNTTILLGGNPTRPQPWDPPLGYISHIRSLGILITPGTGQNITVVSIAITDTSGNILGLPWQSVNNPAADVSIQETVPVDILLLSRHYIRMVAGFNSGTNSNSAGFSIQAILMPQGNVAAF
jgi:hypothetical protein